MDDKSDIDLNEFYKEHNQQSDGKDLQKYQKDIALDIESSDVDTKDTESRSWLENLQSSTQNYLSRNEKFVKCISLGLLTLTYFAYFVTAVVLDFDRAVPLVVINAIILTVLLYYGIKKFYGEKIQRHIITPFRQSTLARTLLMW